MKDNKKANLLLIGAICVVMGVGVLVKDTVKVPNTTEVTAVITHTERNEYHSNAKRGYYVYADFEYNGKSYTDVLVGTSDKSPPQKGEEVVLCISKDNPEEAFQKDDIGKPFILMLVGLLFVTIVGMLSSMLKR